MNPRATLMRLILVIVAVLAPVVSAPAQTLPAKERFHLFLLVGQSNMAGRGKVTEADKTPVPRVLMLNQAGAWVPAVDPMHFDTPSIVGVGLGRTLGIQVADTDPAGDGRLDSVRGRRITD